MKIRRSSLINKGIAIILRSIEDEVQGTVGYNSERNHILIMVKSNASLGQLDRLPGLAFIQTMLSTLRDLKSQFGATILRGNLQLMEHGTISAHPKIVGIAFKLWNGCTTHDQLNTMKVRWPLFCKLYKASEESLKHLLWFCPLSILL